ncbi:hypothetical protein P7C70_g1565, partial [Phenoliferia sp. Uapishka_3]
MHPNPPPTDGPNTRYRISQGLPPLSGSTAPYPSPSASASPYEAYEEREAMERAAAAARDQKNYIMSYEEWKEWKEVAKGAGRQSQLESSTSSQTYGLGLTQSHPSSHSRDVGPTSSYPTNYAEPPPAPAQTLYYVIDPSLEFDPPTSSASDFYYSAEYATQHYAPPTSATYTTDSYYPYASEPYAVENPTQQEHYQRNRIASNSSVVDHGEQQDIDVFGSAPPPAAAPAASMTKEEWLRMGGFEDDTSSIASSSAYLFPAEHRPQPQPYAIPPPPPGAASFVFDAPPPPLPKPRASRARKTGSSASSIASGSPRKSRAAPYPSSSSSASYSTAPSSVPAAPSSYSTFDSVPLPSLPISLPPQILSKKSHSRKKSITHIPRPRNSFMLFRSHAYNTGMIPKDVGLTDHKNISKVVGDIWRRLEPEEKKVWDLMAEKEKREHRERYPDYKYQPKQKPKLPKVEEGPKKEEGESEFEVGLAVKPKAKRIRSPKKVVEAPPEQPVRRTNRIRTKPAGGSYVYNDENEVDEEDEEDESEVIENDAGTNEGPEEDHAAGMAAGMNSWTIPPITGSSLNNSRIEWTQDRVEAVAQAVLEGVPEADVAARVEADLAQMRGEPQHQPLPRPSSLPFFPTSADDWPPPLPPPGPTSSNSTPNKFRSSIHQRPKIHSSKTSPASLCRSSGSVSSESDATPPAQPFRHSRLARRDSALNRSLGHSSDGSAASPLNSPQRMGMSPSGKHPLSMSYPPPRNTPAIPEEQATTFPPSPNHPAFTRDSTSKGSTYSSLGINHPPPSPAFSSSMSPAGDAPSPFVHPSSAFDNSPLLGGMNGERRFSLGRWELRKPSGVGGMRNVSTREMRAMVEEEDAASSGLPGEGGSDVAQSMFDLTPAFAGIEELGEEGEGERKDEWWNDGKDGGFHHGDEDLFAMPKSIRSIMGGKGGESGAGERRDGGEEADDEASTVYSEAFTRF